MYTLSFTRLEIPFALLYTIHPGIETLSTEKQLIPAQLETQCKVAFTPLQVISPS